MNKWFTKVASAITHATGHAYVFALAFASVIIWAVSGPIFDYSETWQLVINTSTTIVTFLMVFLLQNSQNRDAIALHAKLDELLHAVQGARDELEHVEDLDEDQIKQKRR